MKFQLMGLWQCMCKSTCTKARVEGREAPQEHTHMYIWLGNFRKLFTQAPVVQTQQNLFLVFIWQVLCLFRNHAIYLCHREPVSWQNSSVVSSAMRRCSADALEFESLSTQIILDWIGLDCSAYKWGYRIHGQGKDQSKCSSKLRKGSIWPTEVPGLTGVQLQSQEVLTPIPSNYSEIEDLAETLLLRGSEGIGYNL
jgi:hypothetical protein